MRVNRIIVPGDLVRLDWVDLYAFLGRDHHPTPSDEGQTFVVLEAESRHDDPDWLGNVRLTCMRCSDGAKYDLMDHEVELIAGMEDVE